METTATDTATTALASTTRPRWGTRVNVVRPVRWLHSPVTDRIAISGRITARGKPIASVNVLNVSCAGAAKRTTPTVASTDAMPMPATSQNPVRVSKDLRSSTATIRDSGIGAYVAVRAGRRATVSRAMVLMLLLLLVGRAL